MPMSKHDIQRVTKALKEIAAGRMVILVDDEDRENEGDLCMAAEFATPETVNFMALYARGLICLTLTPEHVQKLELSMMVDDNRSPRKTAFTVSIEAREGVSTGISAADRAHTIRTAVSEDVKAYDLVRPGHVFPLKAKPGGVLQRTGHTEGSVDLARLAGCRPAGVICEIMNDDGTMARLTELTRFAEQHQLQMVSIEELVEYRMQKERLIRRIGANELQIPGSTCWQVVIYESTVEHREVMALVLGDPTTEPTLVRVHTGTVVGDILGMPWREQTTLREAMHTIEKEGRGVIIFFPNRGRLSEEFGFRESATVTSDAHVLREFGVGAQVLRDLGLTRVRLLTKHPMRIVGLDGYGLEVVEQIQP